MERPFVVLSLDGGGVRGVLTARILQHIEQLLNQHYGENEPIGRRVDLIAGTSTGGILALGLGSGRSAAELVDWYERRIPHIFAASGLGKWLRSLWSPRHRSDALENSLGEFFGERTLADAICDLCIVSVALGTAAPRLYKTGYLDRNAPRATERMVDVALATSAAPTYFRPAFPKVGGGPLIDGGLCANNPSMIAFTDVLQYARDSSLRGTPKVVPERWRHDLLLISIGTGQRGAMPYEPRNLIGAGKFRWVRPVIEIFAEAQGMLADRQAAFLLGNNYLRINPQIGRGVELDDAHSVDSLRPLADLDQDTTAFLTAHASAFRCKKEVSGSRYSLPPAARD